MLSMILQICGLGIIIGGIRIARSSDDFYERLTKCKFDFWYLWRNSEISTTAWRFWGRRGTSSILPNLNTRLQ